MNLSKIQDPRSPQRWILTGASPMGIARDYGIVRHVNGATFDDMAYLLREAGMSLHPSIIASNWEPVMKVEKKDFRVLALNCPIRASQRRVRRDTGLRGLQPLSPRETLAFLLAHAQSLDDDMHFVSLGYVWHDVDNLPAVIGCFRFIGQPHIGPVPADEDGSYGENYHFLAKE